MRDRMSLRSAKQQFIAYLMTARAAAIRQSQQSQFHVRNNTAWVMVSQPNGTNTMVNQNLRMFRTRNVTITMGGSPANDSIVYDARGIEVWPVSRAHVCVYAQQPQGLRMRFSSRFDRAQLRMVSRRRAALRRARRLHHHRARRRDHHHDRRRAGACHRFRRRLQADARRQPGRAGRGHRSRPSRDDSQSGMLVICPMATRPRAA